MSRWVVFVLVALGACGRIDFDPIGVVGDGGPPDQGGGFVGTNMTYIKASNTHGTATCYRVALSADGSTLAVGCIGEKSDARGIDGDQSDRSLTGAGAVFVFARVGNVWSQQAYIKASNTDGGDAFGINLALSTTGDTLAVGAHFEASAATVIDGNQADNSAMRAGAVYVFVRSGTTWQQQAYLKASNAEPQDLFGRNVALSGDGNTLGVTAPFEDSGAEIDGNQADNSVVDSGAAYMFVRTGSTWTQQAYLKPSVAIANRAFGTGASLSEDGTTFAVGAFQDASGSPGIDGNQMDMSASRSGSVFVFSRAGSVWTQDAYIKAAHPRVNDNFGAEVSLSANGDLLAVGAAGVASSAAGIDVDETDSSMQNAGAVFVFARTGGAWAQATYIKASNPDAMDDFGSGLALSKDGRTLAVGAMFESSAARSLGGDQLDNSAGDAGAVYVFSHDGTAWSQRSYVKATNSDAGDAFGGMVALSRTGETLAVAAGGEASAATGIDGDQGDNSMTNAGAVYVYQ